MSNKKTKRKVFIDPSMDALRRMPSLCTKLTELHNRLNWTKFDNYRDYLKDEDFNKICSSLKDAEQNVHDFLSKINFGIDSKKKSLYRLKRNGIPKVVPWINELKNHWIEKGIVWNFPYSPERYARARFFKRGVYYCIAIPVETKAFSEVLTLQIVDMDITYSVSTISDKKLLQLLDHYAYMNEKNYGKKKVKKSKSKK